MPTNSLRWLTVPNGAVQLVSLIHLAGITVRGHRETARIDHAIARLIIQDEEKTRSEIRTAGAHS